MGPLVGSVKQNYRLRSRSLTAPFCALHSIDGSVCNDIPAQQLALLFHCTRIVVSQTNPHVLPFLPSHDDGATAAAAPTDLHAGGGGGGLTAAADGRPRPAGPIDSALQSLESFIRADVGARTAYLVRLRLLPRIFGAELVSQASVRVRGVDTSPH